MTPPGDARVEHRADRSRYELLVAGALRGIAEYRIAARDGRVVFFHTVVDEPLRGQGYAEQLVGAALDDVRAAGGRARATCWYVREFAQDHPEYADLFR